MKVSRSAALAIVNAMVKCPPEGKNFLATHLRRLDDAEESEDNNDE